MHMFGIGIILGTDTAYFEGIGLVLIKFTWAERWELLSAYVKCALQGFQPSFADCMSPDLESLLCGNRPERYSVVN